MKAALGTEEVKSLMSQVNSMVTTGNTLMKETKTLSGTLTEGIEKPLTTIGKLERSDRGDQIIAQEIVPLELNEENNKPRVFEVMVPNSRFSQGNMARLATVLTTNPGGDRVEIFIEQVDGRVLRAEVPAKVNARSIPLLAEAKAIVGNQGRVTVI